MVVTDPKRAFECSQVVAHITLAEKHLEEGRNLIDGDPVQASEKLYKAAGGCVKALAPYLNLEEIVVEAEERGRWTATELEKAVLRAAQKIGEWILGSWNHAWALHVWGFHEANLDAEDIRARLPYIEKIVIETKKIISAKYRVSLKSLQHLCTIVIQQHRPFATNSYISVLLHNVENKTLNKIFLYQTTKVI